MSNPSYPEPAVSVCFAVTIDDMQLGTFNSCEGLGVEVVMEQREEGGNNGFVWQLPTRMKFSNVKLTRPALRGHHRGDGLARRAWPPASRPRPRTSRR